MNTTGTTLALVAAFGLLLTSCQPTAKAGADIGAKTPTPVHAVPVRLFTPQSGEKYSASLSATKQLTLSFRLAGFVESIYGGDAHRLEAGDLVPAGAVLAVLRPKDYDIQILQARAQLDAARRNVEVARQQVAEAEAGLVKAEATWKRAASLFESRALTAPDYEAAKAQRDIADAQLRSARAQVEVATAQENTAAAVESNTELAKADTVLTAPYKARLLQRSIEVGSLVAPGQPAFTLADTTVVKAVFGVPDSSVVALKHLEKVPLAVEAIRREVTGTITSIAAAADPATRLFAIEATVPNPDGALRPGMIATVSLRSMGNPVPVAVLPLSAIIRSKDESGGFSVMVVRGNRVRAQAVTPGATYGDQIAVAGVQPGELAVTSGASLLSEGESVEVIQ
jgi:multidrug efflux system membrane fusion protein